MVHQPIIPLPNPGLESHFLGVLFWFRSHNSGECVNFKFVKILGDRVNQRDKVPDSAERGTAFFFAPQPSSASLKQANFNVQPWLCLAG